MSNRYDKGKEALWFVAGTLIGAGVALLFAPQSGKRTRRDIQRFGQSVWRRADRFTEDIQHSLGDLMEEIGRASQSAIDAGRDVSSKTKAEILDILDSGRKFLEEQKRRWEKTIRG